MTSRTSSNCPLRIDEVGFPGGGIIGITICPGKKDKRRGWDRDLLTDMAAVDAWGAGAMVTLMEDHEFDLLKVRQLPIVAIGLGISWFHVPIRDVSIPDFRFHERWIGIGIGLREMLQGGEKVLIHCRGGLGRSGLVAAMLLIDSGVEAQEAVRRIRSARPGAIETIQQEAFVRGYRKSVPHIQVSPLQEPTDRINALNA